MSDKYTPQDLQDNLDYLNETKALIKQAIIDKEQQVSDSDTFRSYADKIKNIQTGVDTSDATATANDLIYPKTAYVNETKVTGAIIPTFGESAPTNADIINTTATILDVNYDLGIAILKESDTSFSLIKIKDNAFDSSSKVIYNLTDLGAASKTIRGAKLENIMTDGCNVYLVTSNAKSANYPTWLENAYQLIALNVGSDLQKITCVVKSGTLSSNYYGNNFAITVRPGHIGEVVIVCMNNRSYYGHYNIHSYLFNGTSVTLTTTLDATELGRAGQQKILEVYWDDTGDYLYTYLTLNEDNVAANAYYVITKASGGTYTIKYKSATKAVLINNGQYITGSTIKNISDNVTSGTCSYSISASVGIFGSYIFDIGTTSVIMYKLVDGVITKVSTSSKYNNSAIYRDYGKAVIYYTGYSAISGFLNVPSDTIDSMVRLDRIYYFPEGANVTNSDVVKGKIAYNMSGKVVGTMADNGAKIITPGDSQITIPAGYHNGNGYVKATNIANLQEYKECEIIADAILEGSPLHSELQYFTMSGTQYIDPQVTVDSNYILEIKYLLTGSSSGMGRMFGGSTDMHFEMAASGTTQFRWSINGTGTNVSFTSGVAHIFKCHGNGLCYIDGVQKANLARNQTSTKLWLFDNFSHKEHAKGTFYYCKIWNGSTLVRDFIPVQTTSGEVCLYDKISKTYFKNAGTGVFTAGPVV